MEIQIKKSFSKDIDKIHDKNILKSVFEIKLFFSCGSYTERKSTDISLDHSCFSYTSISFISPSASVNYGTGGNYTAYKRKVYIKK